MTNVRKYEPSRTHQRTMTAMGFHYRDPDFRGPVQPQSPIMARQDPPTRQRIDEREVALLRAREGNGRDLARGLVLLAIAAFGFSTIGADALAAVPACCDPHPILVAPDLPVDQGAPDTISGRRHSNEPTAIDWLGLPPLTDPVWVPGLLIVLAVLSFVSLLTQWLNLSRHRSLGDRPMDVQLELPHLEKPAKLQKHPSTDPTQIHPWRIEGATRTGKVRKENQDTFQIRKISETLSVATLNDGAGGVEGGREAAVTAADVLAAELSTESATPWIERLPRAIERTRQVFAWKKLGGLTTAIVMVFDGEWLHYATLGDGALTVVWPDGMVADLLVPHHVLGQPSNLLTAYIGDACIAPARIGSVRLEPGCSVLAMSDGASDLFPIEDYAAARNQYHPLVGTGGSSLSSQFLEQLEEARDPTTGAFLHHDNMTLVLAAYGQSEVQHGQD